MKKIDKVMKKWQKTSRLVGLNASRAIKAIWVLATRDDQIVFFYENRKGDSRCPICQSEVVRDGWGNIVCTEYNHLKR